VYRALEHKAAKDRCKQKKMMALFPDSINDFAVRFVTLQEKRHDADYNPRANFKKTDVLLEIEQARVVISAFNSTPKKHLRAFCAYVLFKIRDPGGRILRSQISATAF